MNISFALTFKLSTNASAVTKSNRWWFYSARRNSTHLVFSELIRFPERIIDKEIFDLHINDNCFYETKRKEEEIKYIMNWCFKFLEKKLGESGACVSNTTQQFYDYYFGEICAEKGVELREYYKPTFTKNSKLPTRSFKKEYLKTLFRSEKFYQDTLLAFKEYFYVSQMKFIQERIEKIFFMLRTF